MVIINHFETFAHVCDRYKAQKKFRTAHCQAKAKPAAPKAAPTCKGKQWSKESMITALNEFKKGIYPINKIAMLYGVPKSTLHDSINGRVRHDTKPGPSPYLYHTEEEELADHLITVAKISYGKTRKEVKMIADSVAEEKKVYTMSNSNF